MKNLKLIGLALLSALTFSCSDEDREDFTKDLSDNLEATFLESDEIEDGIAIEGATFVKTAPPAPTSDISFTGDARKAGDSTAEFVVTTDEAIDGVYAQLTTRNGTTVDRYFDIPVNQLGTPSSTVTASKGQNTTTYTFNLDITNFTEVPVGTFCLSFCIYRGPSVSTPLVGCATIEIIDGAKVLTTVTIQ